MGKFILITLDVVVAARHFSMDESTVQQIFENRRTRAGLENPGKWPFPLSKSGHPITTPVANSDGYPLVDFYNPLCRRLQCFDPNKSLVHSSSHSYNR